MLVNGGRVEYVTEAGKDSLYWNIPIANTTSILLGTGTSITQAAMRELAKAGVLVGFCGGGGTPLFAGTEAEVEAAWLTPQSEYRPTEYLQKWVRFWFDDLKRLQAAKLFQYERLKQIKLRWVALADSRVDTFNLDQERLQFLINRTTEALSSCDSTRDVLAQEAILTKSLYKVASNSVNYGTFSRAKGGSGVDVANRFLDHGNYLAYGLGATAAWVMGLPHGLSVLHGKTRRGGLVFDIADLVKDAVVLPQAFIAAMAGDDEMQFRNRVIQRMNIANALDVMIDSVKHVANELGDVE